jgi:uncharacterized protein YndB with AHSA1/START domain
MPPVQPASVVIALSALACFLCLAAVVSGQSGGTDAGPAPDTGPLVHEADLAVPVEQVWRVFSTDEGYKLLGVAQAKVDFRVGGKILTHYDPLGVLGDLGTIEQTILAFEPMRMFAYHITRPPKGFPFTEAYKQVWAVATLTDLGGGRTRLRLAQVGYGPDDESRRMRAFFAQGNAWVMQILKRNLEGDPAAGVPQAAAGAGAAAREAKAAPPDSGDAGRDALEPIVAETTVDAPVGEVWRCWTTAEGMRSFLTEARIELRIGGPFELSFDTEAPAGERGSEGCTILSYEPERMLSFSWNAPPSFGPLRRDRTWVVLRIDPFGPHQTKVTLKHLGFAEKAAADPDHARDWAGVRAYFLRAWPSVLSALTGHFAPPQPER